MLVPATAPQPADPFARLLERDWKAFGLNFLREDLPRLLAIFLVAFVIWRVILFFTNRMRRLADRQVANAQRAAQLRTLAGIISATSYAILGFIVLLQVLLVFGVHVEPLLASAGVVGVGIGLGAQSIFKDMLNGIFILIEDQYNVGETVKIAGLAGTVEQLTLRTTTLRDTNGSLYIIPNSQITTVSNQSRDFSNFSDATLTVSVDTSADPDRVLAVLRQLAAEVRGDPAFKQLILDDPSIPGVSSISGREVDYPITMRVRPDQKDGVLRELRRRLLQDFDREGIQFAASNSTLLVNRLAPPQDATAPPPAVPAT